MRPLKLLFLFLFLLCTTAQAQTKDNGDSQKLGIALDYFASGKYHEALMMLSKLDKKYDLNPRFKAYIGVCYYHEWEYEQACKYLDKVLTQLDVYAPHERSIYYHAAAESHFQLQEYDKAISPYEQQLLVCYENEKGDILFRLGFCYMFNENWACAADYFNSAIAFYERYSTPDAASRIAQMRNMVAGCEEKMRQNRSEEDGEQVTDELPSDLEKATPQNETENALPSE